MRIAYENYIDSTTTLTALTAVAGLPIENVQEQRLSVVYKTTAVTSQSVIINFGSAKSINTAAILGHNFTSSVTVTVSANSSDSWPGATSQTITYNSDIMLKFFTTETYQYWKFSIDDPTNTAGFLSIGRLWLGQYIDFSPASNLDFTVTKNRSDIVTHGRHRQKFSSIGSMWRTINLSFPLTEEAMIVKLNTMFNYTGNHSSLIFCNFDTIRNNILVEPLYCSVNGNLDFNHQNRQKYTYTLKLEEEK